MEEQKPEENGAFTSPKRGRGGRPKNEPGTVRDVTIGVRVSPSEYVALKSKADIMGVTPAQFMRDATLKRRLPSPPVPEINRTEYASLARLSANLNQLARATNEGRAVTVNTALLVSLADEVKCLRLALIGAGNGK